MSRQNVELLRGLFAAYNDRDIEELISYCHQSIEFRSAFAAVGGAVYQGHDGMRSWHRDFEVGAGEVFGLLGPNGAGTQSERRAALSAPTLSSCPLPPTARPRRMSGARSGSPQCTRRDPLCRRRSRHTRDRDLQSRQRASSPHSRHGLTHRLQHRNQTRRISLQQEPVSRLRSRRRPPCEPCPQGGLSPPTGYLYTVRL